MNHRPLGLTLAALLIALAGSACLKFHPVQMETDPNQAAHKRMEEQTELASIEAFITEHPNFDSQTKKELREGRINRQEALRRHPEAAPAAAPSPRP